MELQTLTPHIRYLPHDPQRDRLHAGLHPRPAAYPGHRCRILGRSCAGLFYTALTRQGILCRISLC